MFIPGSSFPKSSFSADFEMGCRVVGTVKRLMVPVLVRMRKNHHHHHVYFEDLHLHKQVIIIHDGALE